MRRGGFPNPQMTRAANRLAFTMWLSGCSDVALATAKAESLARSYGLPAGEIESHIRQQQITRRLAS